MFNFRLKKVAGLAAAVALLGAAGIAQATPVVLGYAGSIVTETIAADGMYDITAMGAAGGAGDAASAWWINPTGTAFGGLGASATGTFHFAAGDVLYILVGGAGADAAKGTGGGGGGGGGSFVVGPGGTLLVAAGGGGGGGLVGNGLDASAATFGVDGYAGAGVKGIGGTGGAGGTGAQSYAAGGGLGNGGGGGGFFGDGGAGGISDSRNAGGGKSYGHGAAGGYAGWAPNSGIGGVGGFGGGAGGSAGGGGGGGYSGGGGSFSGGGGGGGSYVDASTLFAAAFGAGFADADGAVTLSLHPVDVVVAEPDTLALFGLGILGLLIVSRKRVAGR